MVSSTPNNTDSQFVTSLMSENSGNIKPTIKPTINPAKDSFDKSKKYPANFSRLASDFFRFSSFIFLTRSKLLIFFLHASWENRKFVAYQLHSFFLFFAIWSALNAVCSFFYFLSSSTLMSLSFSSSNFSRASIFCCAIFSSWLTLLSPPADSFVMVLMALPCIATALFTELT